VSPQVKQRTRLHSLDLYEDFEVTMNDKDLAGQSRCVHNKVSDNAVISMPPLALSQNRSKPSRHEMDLRVSQISAASCVNVVAVKRGGKRTSDSTTTSTATKTTTKFSNSKDNLLDEDDKIFEVKLRGGDCSSSVLVHKEFSRKNSLGEFEDSDDDGYEQIEDGDEESCNAMSNTEFAPTSNNDNTSYFTEYPDSIRTMEPTSVDRTKFADIQRRFFENGITKPKTSLLLGMRKWVSTVNSDTNANKYPTREVIEVESVSSDESENVGEADDQSTSSYYTQPHSSDKNTDVVEVESEYSDEEYEQNSNRLYGSGRRSSYSTEGSDAEVVHHHVTAALDVAKRTRRTLYDGKPFCQTPCADDFSLPSYSVHEKYCVRNDSCNNRRRSVSDYDAACATTSMEATATLVLSSISFDRSSNTNNIAKNRTCCRSNSKTSPSYDSMEESGESSRSDGKVLHHLRDIIKEKSFHSRGDPSQDFITGACKSGNVKVKVKTFSSDLVKELRKIKFDDTDKIVELELESSRVSIQEDQKILDELGVTLAKSRSFHGCSSRTTPRRTGSIYGSSRDSSQVVGNIQVGTDAQRSHSFRDYNLRNHPSMNSSRTTQISTNRGSRKSLDVMKAVDTSCTMVSTKTTSNARSLANHDTMNFVGEMRLPSSQPTKCVKSAESKSFATNHQIGSSFSSIDQSEVFTMGSDRLKMFYASLVSVDTSIETSSLVWEEFIFISLKHSPYESRVYFAPSVTKSRVDFSLQTLLDKSTESCPWYGDSSPGFVGDVDKDGYRHGYGIYRSKNGNFYRGEWKKGKKDGFGIASYGANIYLGQWKNNMRHGHGVMKIENGDVFEGDWGCHVKDGVGAYHYGDGEVDISLYKNDKRIGTSVRWSSDRQIVYELDDQIQVERRILVDEASDVLSHLGVDIIKH